MKYNQKLKNALDFQLGEARGPSQPGVEKEAQKIMSKFFDSILKLLLLLK